MAQSRPFMAAASPTGSYGTPSATPGPFSPAPGGGLASASLSPVASTSGFPGTGGRGKKRKATEQGVGRGKGKRAKAAAAAAAAQAAAEQEAAAATPRPPGEQSAGPNRDPGDGAEEEDDDEDDEDEARGGGRLADDDYTIRKREDQANKEKLRYRLFILRGRWSTD